MSALDRLSLERFIARAAGAGAVTIVQLEKLSGGAIQENYTLDLDISGGPWAGRQRLVLRTDSPSGVSTSLSRVQEFAVVKTAFAAGVTVPEPLWLCEDPGVIGKSFYLMRWAAGSAAGRDLVRNPLPEPDREALVERIGAELARLHRLRPPVASLGFLEPPALLPALHRIAYFRDYLDTLDQPQPVLEWGLRWLERHAPPVTDLVLTHGDCRTGNYLVEDGRLTALLDWEFASWSDPLEDLGWFCARCWRFGAWDREAGGIGSREAFYRGYESVSGQPVQPSRVHYWEVLAALRWGVIALQQAQRHLSGEQPSLELALTGRMAPEMELDILTETARFPPE